MTLHLYFPIKVVVHYRVSHDLLVGSHDLLVGTKFNELYRVALGRYCKTREAPETEL